MNENNYPNIDGEENLTPVEETVEEVVEEEVIEESVEEDAAEEILEAGEDVVEEVFDEAFEGEDIPGDAEQIVDFAEEVKTKGGAGKVVAIVVVVVAILAAAGFGVFKYLTRNPYNEMGYVNTSGRTIEDVAIAAGVTLDEFLAEYGLPADMPADTEESAAYYNIPTSKIAGMYGMDMATLKEMLGLGDDVTENTPWGEAEGKSPIGKYIGEANLEQFKEMYGFGEEITAETTWGEIRNIVAEKDMEAQKQAEEEAKKAAEDAASDETAEDAAAEDAAAEGEVAPEGDAETEATEGDAAEEVPAE
ncbi:MAG: hypothetical protein KIG65_02585 [Eubacteriales bacterium]|nr:hypothetical protein [Eubacteriales bacterium]